MTIPVRVVQVAKAPRVRRIATMHPVKVQSAASAIAVRRRIARRAAMTMHGRVVRVAKAARVRPIATTQLVKVQSAASVIAARRPIVR
ncbi:MAG: hypothetical protein IOC29_34395, partial [Burkholderia sp.]|nr:hypothetical protein [Burkholderia sp.]MCA3874803.1 hypothetical protein [Burkholderia sp.]